MKAAVQQRSRQPVNAIYSAIDAQKTHLFWTLLICHQIMVMSKVASFLPSKHQGYISDDEDDSPTVKFDIDMRSLSLTGNPIPEGFRYS
jgi:hypothetical protein